MTLTLEGKGHSFRSGYDRGLRNRSIIFRSGYDRGSTRVPGMGGTVGCLAGSDTADTPGGNVGGGTFSGSVWAGTFSAFGSTGAKAPLGVGSTIADTALGGCSTDDCTVVVFPRWFLYPHFFPLRAPLATPLWSLS